MLSTAGQIFEVFKGQVQDLYYFLSIGMRDTPRHAFRAIQIDPCNSCLLPEGTRRLVKNNHHLPGHADINSAGQFWAMQPFLRYLWDIIWGWWSCSSWRITWPIYSQSLLMRFVKRSSRRWSSIWRNRLKISLKSFLAPDQFTVSIKIHTSKGTDSPSKPFRYGSLISFQRQRRCPK